MDDDVLAQHKIYIRRETGVAMVINAALSALAYWLTFGGIAQVPMWGTHGWVFDFIPQSFMVALMTTLVPGLITRKAIRNGKLTPAGNHRGLPRSLVLRALTLALAAAALGWALMAALISLLGPASLNGLAAMSIKIAYGAFEALIVSPIALRRALAAD